MSSVLSYLGYSDNWLHQVIFKGCKYDTNLFGYPACTAGARKDPPEDIGEVEGYNLLLEAIATKNKKAIKEFKAWLGYDYDPDSFSADQLHLFKNSMRQIK